MGYLYLGVIRLVGPAIIWVSFALIVSSLLFGGFYTYFIIRNNYLPVTSTVYIVLTWASYLLWGFSALTCLLLLCCYNSIKLGIAVFKTTSQYIQANMNIFALPVVGFVICTLWLLLWFSATIMVFSTGTPTYRGVPFEYLTNIQWTSLT